MAMLYFSAADDFASQIIQRREQSQSAVANIIMCFGLDLAGTQRQARLCALQCLTLAFFVTTQHKRLIGRIQIKPDDIPEFLFKKRILGKFERTYTMRF